MKKIAYVIGMASLFFAILILETLFNGSFIITIVWLILSLILSMFFLGLSRDLQSPFEQFDIENIKRLLKSNRLSSLIYDSRRLLEFMLKISVGEYGKVTKEYYNFTLKNDIDQYKESYIFQYLFLMKNDIDEFLKIKKDYNLIRNKVLEDNIKVMQQPGTISIHSVKYEFNLDLLDDVYSLYNDTITFDEIHSKQYKFPIYNYMKEKALYYYLTNTEQLQRRHAFWEESDYVFDEFFHIENPEEE